MNAMVQEAEERDTLSIRTSLEDYLKLRRRTGAIKPSFDLILLPLEIPPIYLESPLVEQLETIAIDLIAVANVSHHIPVVFEIFTYFIFIFRT